MASSSLPAVLDTSTDLYSLAGLTQFTIATIVIAFIALFLRFWAKYLSAGANFGIDDYLAFAAYPPAVTVMVLVLRGHINGLGMHTTADIPPYYRTAFAQSLYAGELLWDVSTSLLRFSALAFYARIFHVRTNPSRIWRYLFWLTFIVTVLWLLIALLIEGVLLCSPISKFWDHSEEGTCLSEFSLLLASTVGCLIVDVMVVILPLPQVFNLNLSVRRKVAVSFTFLLGYAAAFMSIGRLVICVELADSISEDPFFYLVPYLYWDVAQAGFSVLAVCLPAIFQLTRQVRSQGPGYLLGRTSKRSTFNFESSNSTLRPVVGQERDNARCKQPDWDNLYDGSGFGSYVTVSGGPDARRQGRGREFGRRPFELSLSTPSPPEEGISVTRDVHVAMTDFA